MNLYEHQSTYNPNMPVRFLIYLAEEYFVAKEQKPCVELTVRMLNINYGHNSELLERCSVLKEYAQFVAVSRQYIADGLDAQEAFSEAIDYCMNHGVLYEVLKNYRAEVLGMLLEEFDVEKYERTIRMEGREEGIEQGIEQLSGLTSILLEQNRLQDLKRALKDKKYRDKLFREFGL